MAGSDLISNCGRQQKQGSEHEVDSIADRDAFWIKELERERQKNSEARESLQQQLEAALAPPLSGDDEGLGKTHKELDEAKAHNLQLQEQLHEQGDKCNRLNKDVEELQAALQERDSIWQAELVASQSELNRVKQELDMLKVCLMRRSTGNFLDVD